MEASSEAEGLRGEFVPKNGDLLLVRDETLSRDSALILDSMLAAHLRNRQAACSRREVTIESPIFLVAAQMSPSSHRTLLRKLGASAAAVSGVTILDSRASSLDGVTAFSDGEGSIDSEKSLLEHLLRALSENSLIFIDSANALQLGLNCNASTLVRIALSRGAGIAVALDISSASRTDSTCEDLVTLTFLEDIASVIVDIRSLLSNTEYNGRVAIQKIGGAWCAQLSPSTNGSANPNRSQQQEFAVIKNDLGTFLYKFSESSIRYYR